jgi:hypothetical protein
MVSEADGSQEPAFATVEGEGASTRAVRGWLVIASPLLVLAIGSLAARLVTHKP